MLRKVFEIGTLGPDLGDQRVKLAGPARVPGRMLHLFVVYPARQERLVDYWPRWRRWRRCWVARRSACSKSWERTPPRAMTRPTKTRAMEVVRQRRTSPGEPGTCATLVKESAKEMRARTPMVAARM